MMIWEGGRVMARGKGFNHKRKSHPGNFPLHAETGGNQEQHTNHEQYIVTKEAFKNRVGGQK